VDVVTLSRIQFGLNISFHYIFPPISIGLGILLVFMEGAFLWTKNPIYERMTRFWVKIFALIFAVGVGTGLVQVFAFGTNWASFSRFVGDVFGSILGAEGIFAFFMESGFLAVLLFGWSRCTPAVHFFSTIMVTLGAHFSGVWIVIANSWMQTPAGHAIVGEGSARHAIIQNFWEVLNNPSTLDRLAHVLIGAWLTGAFFVISVSAFYVLRNVHLDFARRCLKMGLVVATVAVGLQAISGDSTARGVAQNQPIKLAAFEGVYQTQTPTSMWVAGVVKPKEKKIVGIELPGLLSFLVYRNFNQSVAGLDQYPSELWPNVRLVFQTYHGMILMWGLMLLAVILGWLSWWRGKISTSKWTLRFLIASVLFPQIANQLGWYSAEMGRQPWIVYGLMRTHEGVSPHLKPEQVIFSLVLFSLIYLMIFILFIYLLDHKIRQGPESSQIDEYRNPFTQQKL
jgi:cytochrome bd ubiquinol oxidase subunit I